MDKKILDTNIVTQIGIVVRDIEKTSKIYADFLGVENPGWILLPPAEVTKIQYIGNSTNARAKIAFLNAGSINIELIEPDSEPSTWREFLDKNGEGIHHIAFKIKGTDEKVAKLEDNGMKLIQKGELKNGRYTYIDASDSLKVIIELLENY